MTSAASASDTTSVSSSPPSGKPREVPYCIYDLANNVGWVGVGISHDTAEFAVATIARWWRRLGRRRFDLRVVDAEGGPVARAEVWVSDYGNSTDGGVIGRTGADGRYHVGDVGRGRSLAARADGHVPSAQREVIGNPGDRVELTLELRGPGAALAGVVRGPDGAPVASAEVLLGLEGTSSMTMPSGEVLTTPPPVWLVCDEQGRFEAHGLAPTCTSRRAPRGSRCSRPRWRWRWARRHRRRSRCANRVQGVVRDGAGQPLAGIPISSGGYMDFDYVRTLSATDGSFLLDGLEAGPIELRATSDEHGKESTSLFLDEGQIGDWNPVLVAGPTLAGTVVDELGDPLAGDA